MMYNHKIIEPKWQAFWDKEQTFKSVLDKNKPKYYCLDMFPYPSGSGLHVGHPEGYTASDIMARYKRARGYNVLHPMGWDAFGLPAEQHAIKTGTAPQLTTRELIVTFKRQLKSLGFSFDWSRELSTAEPNYYRWTQWIFKRLYERGLAYQTEVAVNFCPELKTVLANEEVVDGKSERGGHPVYRVPMKQWMLKITAYAERLLQDLDALDWPESTKDLQRNWIGKSTGLKADFKIENSEEVISVFTTRGDTIYGVTYLVLAPEHTLTKKIRSKAQQTAVDDYVLLASKKSEIARQDQNTEKTGVSLGVNVLHPLTGEKIPVWTSDYVLAHYGTGAVMAVPAHDVRDHDFARKFDLPIKQVIFPKNGALADISTAAFTEDGVCRNSGHLDGLDSHSATAKIIAIAEENKFGQSQVQYKLRDWLFSRQRYWGEPFPVIHYPDRSLGLVSDQDLPVTLPQVTTYEPTEKGESPLRSAHEWLKVSGEKGDGLRETDTMPGSAASSWYFLRFCDPKNDKAPFDFEALKYWMPVDLYVGGPEHAVGHLLYSRFWTKVLYDAELVPVSEPFQKLVHQGMILGEDGEKMSKSRGNTINPDDIIAEYGADTLRVYEMFMGPLSQDKPWSTKAIEGSYRFLQRTWRCFVQDNGELALKNSPPTKDDLKSLHQTIAKVTDAIESMRFNTGISAMMICINHFTKSGGLPKECASIFVQLLAPFAPHMAEELWQLCGQSQSLSYAPWPAHDPELAKEDLVTIAIQVLGKTRGTIEVSTAATQAEIESAAKEVFAVKSQLEGKEISRVVYVEKRLLNFIAK